MANELQGRRVAILLAPVGTEQAEFTEPKKAVEDAGAQVDVVGLQTGEAQTMNSDVNPGETFVVEKTFSEVSPGEGRTRCAVMRRRLPLCAGSSSKRSRSE